MTQLPLPDAIPRFKANEERLDAFVNGSETGDFLTSDGTSVPSIRAFLAGKDVDINTAADGILEQATIKAASAADSAEAATEAAEAAAASAAEAALFNPTNFYTKTSIDSFLSDIDGSIDAAEATIAANALEIADLKGERLGMVGGIADPFDDTSGIAFNLGGIDDNTLLAIHCDGANLSTSFTDSSHYARVVAALGDAKITTAQSVFGVASAQFDGSGDSLAISDSDDWAFGTGNFTIEARIKLAGLTGGAMICSQETGAASNCFRFYLGSDTALYFQVYSGSTLMLQCASAAGALVANTWYHLAVVRNGNIFTIYRDGVAVVTVTSSVTVPDFKGPLKFGMGPSDNPQYFNGYMDEIRVSNVARWTAAFTPPAAAYFKDTAASQNHVYDAANDWFSPAIGTPARITGGTPSAPLGGTAANINDNNFTTSIAPIVGNLTSASLNSRILAMIDYGTLRTITKIEAVGLSYSVGSADLGGFYYSPDGTNWTQFGSNVSNGTSPATFSVSGLVNARYVAFILRAMNFAGGNVGIQDLNAYDNGTSGELIDRTLGTAIGDMTAVGGLAAAFDGNIAQSTSAAARPSTLTSNAYIGKNFGASPQTIGRAIAYGSTNIGFDGTSGAAQITIVLRGKNGSAPASRTDGVALGSVTFADVSSAAPQTIISNDPMTAYQYVWVDITSTGSNPGIYVGELLLLNPDSVNNMTLVSIAYQVASAPAAARVALQLAGSNTFVPGTDFSMEVTRDGGTTWTAATLTLSSSFSGIKLYEGTVDLTGQPSGATMRWRMKTLTNKNVIASGVVEQWR
ncbi:LamG-like jellyroll fold domain-containing protein [Rhizobium ruizarguesonis]